MFEHPRIKGEIFTYMIAGRYKSLESNRYSQVFANDSFFASAYHTEKKILSEQGVREFIAGFGVMNRLV